jgi:hypothetical protein
MEQSKSALYLSGSMEYSDDPNTWRKKMFRNLHHHYRVIIPNKADIPFSKDDPEYKIWMKEKFIMPDMINVSTAKHFFVKIDKGVFQGAGTISEITTAAWLGKDMVAFLDGILETEIPSWTLGCLDGAIFVSSIDEAITFFKKRAENCRKKDRKSPLHKK